MKYWLLLFLLAFPLAAAIPISDTIFTATTSGTTLNFSSTMNVSNVSWDANTINVTDIYLNYSLLKDGVIVDNKDNALHSYVFSDGSAYSFSTDTDITIEPVHVQNDASFPSFTLLITIFLFLMFGGAAYLVWQESEDKVKAIIIVFIIITLLLVFVRVLWN